MDGTMVEAIGFGSHTVIRRGYNKLGNDDI